jgi:uncharacterized protein YjeT (DUF2065 family)
VGKNSKRAKVAALGLVIILSGFCVAFSPHLIKTFFTAFNKNDEH